MTGCPGEAYEEDQGGGDTLPIKRLQVISDHSERNIPRKHNEILYI